MVGRLGRDAGTHGNPKLVVEMRPTGIPDRPTKPVGYGGRIIHGQTRKGDTELLTTVAAHQVVLAAFHFQDIGHKDDDVIAHCVAVGIVHGLKVIDVHHDAGQRVIVGLGLIEELIVAVEERTTIQTTGQWVAGRKEPQFHILSTNFIGRYFEFLKRPLQVRSPLLDSGHVVEGCQRTTSLTGSIHNRSAVDSKRLQRSRGYLHEQRYAFLADTLPHRSQPRQVLRVVARPHGPPVEARCFLADQRFGRLPDQCGERFISEDDVLFLVHDQNAFGK